MGMKIKKILSIVLTIACIFVITTISIYTKRNELPLEDTPEVSISEPMTYEEMISTYSKNNNISIIEAYTELTKGRSKIAVASARSSSYRVLKVGLYVNSGYKPAIHYYVTTSESGGYWGITSIYSVQLYRIYNGTSKIFQGNLESWLRSPYQIEYIINGDFYNQATSTSSYTINGSWGINVKISLSITETNSSSYYAPIYQSRTVSFQS